MDNGNKQIHFTNKDSKKDISLTLDKKMIFIYGKNGSGKTTFSRSNDLGTKFVFNEDFIYKNVYIIDGDGAKIDSGAKKNLLLYSQIPRKNISQFFEECIESDILTVDIKR